ncbi:hypothetical protein [Salinivibrio kushneri]|uniref:hypothetical protein n=1 Tax=Salinivibrio kushneri TaxID=1908198 RepID=UPI001056773C|nr:hypothetical protein [Salinivibrio kushneri]
MVDKFLIEPNTDVLSGLPITVLTSYTEKNRSMQIEAFGKRIELRTSIVFAKDLELRGEVKAVYIPSHGEEEKEIAAIWLSEEGIHNEPMAPSEPFPGNAYPALKFIVDSVDRLLNSDECEPSIYPKKRS